MVTVKINGKEITVEDGTLILDAARSAGYEIPTFCYQADLMGIGSCRMCLVEIEGQKKLQPSCVTPVMHGLSILTDTQTVTQARAGVLEFLLANHALDCPVCDKGGECELQDAVYKHGPHHGRHAEKKFKFHEKDIILSPVIVKNSNRCVQCMKCVRVCREVVGANVLGALNRGDHQEPTSFLRSFLDCDQDGNCIEVCPVGCFMRLPYRYKTRPWDLKGADTVCPYCATGCRMVVEERDGVVIRARAQLGVGLNSETLCARGRFGYDYISNKERLTTPLIRKYGKLEPSTWEEAFGVIGERLRAMRPERVCGIASARLTNEELYLFQKLMRGVIGTSNIDSSIRWDSSAAEAFISAAGMETGGVSVFGAMEADTVLIIGAYLTEENPVVDYIVRRISAARRMNVVIASSRAMRLEDSANLVLRHELAGEGGLLFRVILALQEGNKEKLSAIDGIDKLKDLSAETLVKSAGVKEDEALSLAKKLGASNTVSIIAGTEFLRFPEGISGLSLLVGALKSLGKKVAVMPALDRCNQRGAWEMGVLPSLGPGYGRAPANGLNFPAVLEAAKAGDIDALYVIGEDIATSASPDPESAREAVSKAGFLIVQDIFLTETAKMAHVVLPGASPAEKEGTFTNQEGRVQIIRPLMPPPGRAQRDLDIIDGIIEAVTALPKRAPLRPSTVFDEIRKEAPMYSKVSLAFNNKRNSNNMLDLREALVAASGHKVAVPALSRGKEAARDARYPFKLATGNHLFHSGRLSRRSETLIGLMRDSVVEISEEDAKELGLIAGEKVVVKGEHHEAVLTLKTRKGSKRGTAFIPENFEDVIVGMFFRKGSRVPRVGITRA